MLETQTNQRHIGTIYMKTKGSTDTHMKSVSQEGVSLTSALSKIQLENDVEIAMDCLVL